MIKFLNKLFNRITENEIYDIIKWKMALETEKLGPWYDSERYKINKIEETSIKNQQLDYLKYEFYRKKLDIYTNISINIRTKYMKPIKNENTDTDYLNGMWSLVQDKDNRETGRQDTIYMVEMINKEIKTSVKSIKRERFKINAFTLFLSIISGIGGSIITILITNP